MSDSRHYEDQAPPEDTKPQQAAPEPPQHTASVDINNIPAQRHLWVDRGLVMSCEGGDHPPHRAYKRRG
jgi:hypothetical protein